MDLGQVVAELYGGPRDGEEITVDCVTRERGARPEPPEDLELPDEPPRTMPAGHPAAAAAALRLCRVATYELCRGDGAYPNWMINSDGRLVYAYRKPVGRRRGVREAG